MQIVLVRYKTRDGAVAENEALVHAVFDELRAKGPMGIDYATFTLEEPSRFMHFAAIDAAGGANPLLALDAFKGFQRGLDERCVEAPEVTELTAVDGYGRFALETR